MISTTRIRRKTNPPSVGDGPGTSTLDPKGKQKEEPEDDNTNDYKLVAPPPTTDITGFVCAKCKAHNLVRPSSDSWYVVTVGREVGVFSGWYVDVYDC